MPRSVFGAKKSFNILDFCFVFQTKIDLTMAVMPRMIHVSTKKTNSGFHLLKNIEKFKNEMK